MRVLSFFKALVLIAIFAQNLQAQQKTLSCAESKSLAVLYESAPFRETDKNAVATSYYLSMRDPLTAAAYFNSNERMYQGAERIKLNEDALLPEDKTPKDKKAPTYSTAWSFSEDYLSSGYMDMHNLAVDTFNIPATVTGCLMFQESRWDRGATSQVAAKGLGQIMAPAVKDLNRLASAGEDHLLDDFKKYVNRGRNYLNGGKFATIRERSKNTPSEINPLDMFPAAYMNGDETSYTRQNEKGQTVLDIKLADAEYPGVAFGVTSMYLKMLQTKYFQRAFKNLQDEGYKFNITPEKYYELMVGAYNKGTSLVEIMAKYVRRLPKNKPVTFTGAQWDEFKASITPASARKETSAHMDKIGECMKPTTWERNGSLIIAWPDAPDRSCELNTYDQAEPGTEDIRWAQATRKAPKPAKDKGKAK